MDKSVEKEWFIVQKMIDIYCKAHHKGEICDCNLLKEYVKNRLTHCPYGKNKPACIHCTTHCYHKEDQELIRKIMRYSGPRIFWRHPVYTLLHLLKGANIKKAFFVLCGLIAVLLGVIGVILPGIPTTPFMILAAYFFARSSPTLHKKLAENRIFGPIITNWERNRTIPKNTKKIALTMIFLVGTLSFFTLPTLLLKLTLLAVLIIPITLLVRMKTC